MSKINVVNVVLTLNLPSNLDVTFRKPSEIHPLPQGCLTTGVTPVSAWSVDMKTLTCNVDAATLEGRSGVIYVDATAGSISDGQPFTVTDTIDTDQSTPQLSNSVPLTVSAIPKWDWVKLEPTTYPNITSTSGVTGYVSTATASKTRVRPG